MLSIINKDLKCHKRDEIKEDSDSSRVYSESRKVENEKEEMSLESERKLKKDN